MWNSMLQAGYNADQWFNQANTVRIVATYSNFTGLIPSFDYALAKDNTLSDLSWDGYLANVGTKVSDYTNQVYYASKNSYLLAKNVWCEYEKTMASAEMTGASALTYTEGDALYVGDYSAAQKADGTHFAGVAIKAVVTGTNTITSLVVTVTGVNELGVADTVEHITVSGAPGTLSSATTAKFLAITDVSRDSGGSMGDTFAIVNTKDRIISL